MLRVTKSSIQKLLLLCEILILLEKNILIPANFYFFYYTKRKYSQIEPQLKVKVKERRNSLEKIGVGNPPIYKGGD